MMVQTKLKPFETNLPFPKYFNLYIDFNHFFSNVLAING